MSVTNSKLPPSWQILVLVANHLDPKTLAKASCVCKSWSSSLSSDHIWEPICITHYPSLCNLRAANSMASYSRIYSLGHRASKQRLRKPPTPLLSLDKLMFAIDAFKGSSQIFVAVNSGDELDIDPNGVFRFDIQVQSKNLSMVEVLNDLRLSWNVVLKGFDGVFSMMDCKGNGRFVPGTEGWFSEELPWPGCCSRAGGSGLAAELRLCCSVNGERMVVGKVSVGVLSVDSWRYVCVDDVLRYLQHFLLPCEE